MQGTVLPFAVARLPLCYMLWHNTGTASVIGVGAQNDLGGHQTFARKMTLIN